MQLSLVPLWLLVSIVQPSIIENGRLRLETYPKTEIAPVTASSDSWITFLPNTTELSYKGRWDTKYISCRCPITLWRELFLTGLTFTRPGWS
jgi:hypothetical protein